jgi:hypothetical protein
MRLGDFANSIHKDGFLTEEIEALNSFTGKEVGNAAFLESDADSKDNLYSWLPIYFLPIAQNAGMIYSIDLNPEKVKTKTMSIVLSIDEKSHVEISKSLKGFCTYSLFDYEADYHEEGKLSRAFEKSIAIANDTYGKNFYNLDKYSNFSKDDIGKIYYENVEKSDYPLYNYLRYTASDSEKKGLIEKLHQDKLENFLINSYIFWHLKSEDDMRGAAEEFFKAANSWFYLGYTVDLEDFIAEGKDLCSQLNLEIPESIVVSEAVDQTQSLLKIADIFSEGHSEKALKHLTNLCSRVGDFNSPIEIFIKYFETLDLKYALNLARLRPLEDSFLR